MQDAILRAAPVGTRELTRLVADGLDEADREIAALRRAYREAKRRRAALLKTSLAMRPIAPRPRTGLVSVIGGNRRKGERHRDYAERVLREAGGPMRVAAIADAMARLGHPLPSDPSSRYASVCNALTLGEMFVRVRRGLWDLRERAKVDVGLPGEGA